ncbi:MAG: ATPase [Parcubacteria group bacterium]|nr:ATPase [Parcubacteria group bacterium]
MRQSQALEILKTGANVFLTGEPGSGKTHTLTSYISWLRSHGIEPAITASTGIAATHVGGMTIHSWSGIGILERLTPEDLDRISSKEHVAKRIQKTKVLIIDEISMLSAGALSMIDAVAREVRQDSRAFGGIQVVFAGDFFQLPPITRGGTPAEFAFSSAAWRTATPLVCYLTEQHRQDDTDFLDVLGAIRDGTFDHTHASTILSRESDGDELDSEIPRLFTHNADVDRINNEYLAKLPGSAKTYRMVTTGPDVLIEGLKRGCLSPQALVLKEGAIVMCTKNNPAAQYVNGTLGKVIGFVHGSGEPIIETHDGRELTILPSEWALEENGKVRAKIAQLPLRLAWAITVHKSQGMSMDAAAIDLSRTFEYGQGYVALSRVRTLAGLTLLGWSEHAAMVHPEVARMDERLREESLAAEEAFTTLREDGDLEVMHRNFIHANGGTLEAAKDGERPIKRTTYDETLTLILEGMPLIDIAKERKLTVGTIADHAEKLIVTGRLDAAPLLSLIPARLIAALPDIHQIFEEVGTEKLAPAFSKLHGKYTYDELKLARTLFVKELSAS